MTPYLEYFKKADNLPLCYFIYNYGSDITYMFSTWAKHKIVVTELNTNTSWIESVNDEHFLTKDEIHKIFYQKSQDNIYILTREDFLEKIEFILKERDESYE
jgi:hypothetical protein